MQWSYTHIFDMLNVKYVTPLTWWMVDVKYCHVWHVFDVLNDNLTLKIDLKCSSVWDYDSNGPLMIWNG